MYYLIEVSAYCDDKEGNICHGLEVYLVVSCIVRHELRKDGDLNRHEVLRIIRWTIKKDFNVFGETRSRPNIEATKIHMGLLGVLGTKLWDY